MQPWFCDCCGVHGEVQLPPGGTPMGAVADLIRTAHAAMAPLCAAENIRGTLRASQKPANWLPKSGQ